eukprot:gene35637-43941_t
MHKSFANITKPYLASIVVLLSLPDSTTCRRCLQLVSYLLEESAKDNRFVPIVAKEGFGAVLQILLVQAKWSIGMEWELIEFLLDAYLVLVLGESASKQQVTEKSTPPPPSAVVTKNDDQKGWNQNTFGGNKKAPPQQTSS